VDAAPNLDDESQGLLRRICAAANRMDRLIVDVLAYSRIMRAELKLSNVDMEQLIAGILENDAALRERAEVVVQRPLAAVFGNATMLTQVFSNLLDNAAKFVAPGVKPQIHVSSENRGGSVRLYVRDNGVGIAPEYHKKIFGIFQRLDASAPGTGIGLAIVRKAVERMSGVVGLTSSPGNGTKFWIELGAAE
jgi:signal transduction histidine kinase